MLLRQARIPTCGGEAEEIEMEVGTQSAWTSTHSNNSKLRGSVPSDRGSSTRALQRSPHHPRNRTCTVGVPLTPAPSASAASCSMSISTKCTCGGRRRGQGVALAIRRAAATS